ncbi:hypothetical protein A2U01_0003681, partial [Trifolium medium]|nr:hypothetical protein [Trifolium medium]
VRVLQKADMKANKSKNMKPSPPEPRYIFGSEQPFKNGIAMETKKQSPAIKATLTLRQRTNPPPSNKTCQGDDLPLTSKSCQAKTRVEGSPAQLQHESSKVQAPPVHLQPIIPIPKKYYHPPSTNIPFLAPNSKRNRNDDLKVPEERPRSYTQWETAKKATSELTLKKFKPTTLIQAEKSKALKPPGKLHHNSKETETRQPELQSNQKPAVESSEKPHTQEILSNKEWIHGRTTSSNIKIQKNSYTYSSIGRNRPGSSNHQGYPSSENDKDSIQTESKIYPKKSPSSKHSGGNNKILKRTWKLGYTPTHLGGKETFLNSPTKPLPLDVKTLNPLQRCRRKKGNKALNRAQIPHWTQTLIKASERYRDTLSPKHAIKCAKPHHQSIITKAGVLKLYSQKANISLVTTLRDESKNRAKARRNSCTLTSVLNTENINKAVPKAGVQKLYSITGHTRPRYERKYRGQEKTFFITETIKPNYRAAKVKTLQNGLSKG